RIADCGLRIADCPEQQGKTLSSPDSMGPEKVTAGRSLALPQERRGEAKRGFTIQHSELKILPHP
ncbi:MAG TPA: hypothetical protein VN765_07390, partial [Candidatus Acidoferrum sp.]|nr:hypothetical protein [Candidatus Acidoferrum sp.]